MELKNAYLFGHSHLNLDDVYYTNYYDLCEAIEHLAVVLMHKMSFMFFLKYSLFRRNVPWILI